MILRLLTVLLVLTSLLEHARADGPPTALTADLFFGPGYFHIDVDGPADQRNDSGQRGLMLSTQLDVGALLLEYVGLHGTVLYDGSKWANGGGSYARNRAGAFGLGAGVDVRLLSLLGSLTVGWQNTELTTLDDPSSPSGAKSGFLLARAGYVWSLALGLGVGAHGFVRYFWSKDHDDGDPSGYVAGGALSLNFAGGRPLLGR